MSNKIETAMKIASESFEGIYYGDKKYFDYHLMNVYNRVNDLDIQNFKEECLIVALLHDIVEDLNYDIEEIKTLFGELVSDAVLAISYDKSIESRDEYYLRCYGNEISRIVKFADASENKYNCDLDSNHKRSKYYQKVIDIMKN